MQNENENISGGNLSKDNPGEVEVLSTGAEAIVKFAKDLPPDTKVIIISKELAGSDALQKIIHTNDAYARGINLMGIGGVEVMATEINMALIRKMRSQKDLCLVIEDMAKVTKSRDFTNLDYLASVLQDKPKDDTFYITNYRNDLKAESYLMYDKPRRKPYEKPMFMGDAGIPSVYRKQSNKKTNKRKKAKNGRNKKK